jgi:hypothetical protein
MINQTESSANLEGYEITPEMVQAGVEALADTSDASSAFQAKSVFQRMIEVALAPGRTPARSEG